MNSVMLHMQKVMVAGAFVPWALLARRHSASPRCEMCTWLLLTILVVLKLSHISHECNSVTMPQGHIRCKTVANEARQRVAFQIFRSTSDGTSVVNASVRAREKVEES